MYYLKLIQSEAHKPGRKKKKVLSEITSELLNPVEKVDDAKKPMMDCSPGSIKIVPNIRTSLPNGRMWHFDLCPSR